MSESESESFTEDQYAIAEQCDALKALLLEKNRAYGSSAFDPVRVFSRSDALEQINVRIDDKLSRIARADPNALGEDAELDLLGYLVLRRIQRRRMGAQRRADVDPAMARAEAERRRVMDYLAAMSPEEFLTSLVRAGICTPDGKLTDHYVFAESATEVGR